MMTAKFDETKIQEQLKIYKLKREAKLLAEAAQKLEQEKRQAEMQTKIAAIQKACAPKPVTITKPHKCTGCGAIIPKGSRVMVEGEVRRAPAMYLHSSVPVFRSLYYCNCCRALTESEQ
jgi:hypothetical protein